MYSNTPKLSRNFDILNDELENDEPTDNIERKAMKKLREIDKLKQYKSSQLTPEQRQKISKENYWKNILNPPSIKKSHDTPTDMERKKKQNRRAQIKKKKKEERKERELIKKEKAQKEKEERKERERIRKEKAKKEKEAREEKERIRKEKAQKEKEERDRKERIRKEKAEKEKEEREEKERWEAIARNNIIHNRQKCIFNEYSKRYSIHKNKKKVLRLLNLLYHPDKNINNIEWAEGMFKELGNMICNNLL